MPKRRLVLMVLDNPCNPDWRVLKEARSLTAAGMRVKILAWDRTGMLPKEERHGDVHILRIAALSRHRGPVGRLATAFGFWRRVIASALADDFDVVHSHDLPDLPVGVILSLWRRRPLIYDAHEMYWMDRLEARSKVVKRIEKCGEMLLLRRAHDVITVSDHLARYYRTVHPRVSVVGNWYDPIPVDRRAGQQLRQELGIGPSTFCLVYAGSLGPERNHQLLVDYATAYGDTCVVVAGRGPAETLFRQAASRAPNLRFIGWRSDPGPVYGLADALFYALRDDSPYSEIASPNTLFISVATGIPLVTTASGDSGRIVGETGAGEVLSAQTVAEVRRAVVALRDPIMRGAMTERLLALRTTYSWTKAAGTLTAIYGNVFAPGRPSGALLSL